MAKNVENTVKMEEIFIPKGHSGEEANLLVAVNGVNYLLPRGKKSSVPACVADEIRRSQKAQEAMDKRIDEMLAKGK